MRMRLKVAVIGLAMLPAFAGCAVRDATPDGVTIVYNALHPQIADYEAQQHCAQYGKSAVLVETAPAPPSLDTLFTRSSRSVFKCMEVPLTPPGSSPRRSSRIDTAVLGAGRRIGAHERAAIRDFRNASTAASIRCPSAAGMPRRENPNPRSLFARTASRKQASV
jgi:hypothetical protein